MEVGDSIKRAVERMKYVNMFIEAELPQGQRPTFSYLTQDNTLLITAQWTEEKTAPQIHLSYYEEDLAKFSQPEILIANNIIDEYYRQTEKNELCSSA